MSGLEFLAPLGLALLLVLAGVPIFVALLGAGLAGYAWFTDVSFLTVPQVFLAALNSFNLASVPFFILTAELLVQGGASRRLIEFIDAWLGGLSGGAAVVVVLASGFFAAITGSSTACAFAVGSVMVPAMIMQRYPSRMATGVVAGSATLGILIPPSIPLILYGTITEVSIGKLFAAGIVPGALLMGAMAVWASLHARSIGIRGQPHVGWPKRWRTLADAWGILIVPVVLLGCIYTGIASPTEAAGIGCFLALVIGVFVYRELSLAKIIEAIRSTAFATSMIFLIIGGAILLGNYLTFLGTSRIINDLVVSLDLSPTGFMLTVLLIYVVLGTFLEAVSIIYITVPIFFPITQALGIDPIQFAIMLVIGLELAMITPPLGLNLFVLSALTGHPVGQVARGSVPYMVLLLLMAVTIIFWPAPALIFEP